MEYEFDYYFLQASFENQEPRLIVDDEVDSMGASFLAFRRRLPEPKTLHLCLGNPIPPSPNLEVDGLSFDGNCSVFSKKIHDAIAPHNFENLQFVPVIIRGKDDEEYDDFYVLNICKEMYSFDPNETEYDGVDEFTNTWDNIESIVLDKELLSKTPLEERLAFVSLEHSGFILYHKKIVDLIMSTNPKSITAISVEEWYDGIGFE